MKYEWLLLARQKLVMIASLICLILTTLALWNGHHKTISMHQAIEKAVMDGQARLNKQAHEYGNGGSAGDSGYYLFHIVYDEPGAWNFLSLGNRSYSPQIQRIRLLGLESQLYDGESHNPENAVAGHFDYAFVVVFLLPLLCIALSHDLGPAERASGRMALLQTLMRSKTRFWLRRLGLRWLIAWTSVTLPLLVWTLMLALPLTTFIVVAVIVAAYAMLWTLLSGLLSLRSGQPSANANATLSMTLWLLFIVVLPTAAGFFIASRNPVIPGAEIALTHRKLVHDAWDQSKENTFEAFFQAYPAWQDTPPVLSRFHWKWYYAFQHVADMKVMKLVSAREQALIERDLQGRTLGWILPSIGLQFMLDDIAGNNLQHRLEYRAQVRDFHTALRHYYYPYLFNDKPFNSEDFAGIPNFEKRIKNALN